MNILLYFLWNGFSVLLNQLNLDNNVYYASSRKYPDSEDESDNSTYGHLENRDAEGIKRKLDLDSNDSDYEDRCDALQKKIVKKIKTRKADRDEYNERIGVGASSSVSPISDSSDHKQLMEDDKEYIEKKKLEYEQRNSHKEDYSEEEAYKYAREQLSSLHDKADNSDTDSTKTNNEHEETCEPDSEDESSKSNNDSDKSTNFLTKIKDIIKKGGGSGGGASNETSGDGGSNKGGSDNDSNNFFTTSNLILLFFSFLEAFTEYLNYIIGSIQ